MGPQHHVSCSYAETFSILEETIRNMYQNENRMNPRLLAKIEIGIATKLVGRYIYDTPS